MAGPYDPLFQPIEIGSMRLKNRIAMSAMTTNYGSAGFEVSERLIDFHAERARGGVGLLTVEMCSVDTSQRYQPQSLSLGDDRFIEGHRRLVQRVHAEGAKIQPQISHPGPESMTDPVGPSVAVAAGTGWPCRALEPDEMELIARQYSAAALRAQAAGYDGMELHAAHAYMLLGSFLSPQRNRREDAYRGDTQEGRSRFLLEVIRGIKRAVGDAFPLTLRISGHEGSYDGRPLYDTQQLAPQLVDAGVDCIQVSGGVSHDRLVGDIVCGGAVRDGHNVAVASAIRRLVKVPVMAVGRLHSPELAARVVAAGQADIVMMARPLLADPELPDKLRRGQRGRVRQCLSCQNCIDSMLVAPFDANMNCAVNAFSGREGSLRLAAADPPVNVVVVGGGTAGMEAARLAASCGHRVTLLERGPRLGGSLLFAATVHADNERLLDFLLGEISRQGVRVKLNTVADRSLIERMDADVVLVASGAAVDHSGVDVAPGARVFTGAALRQYLSGYAPGQTVGTPVIDWRAIASRALPATLRARLTPSLLRRLSSFYLPFGSSTGVVGDDLIAVELAEFIARRGRSVMLLSEAQQPMSEIGPKRRQEQLARLDSVGVEVLTAIDIDRVERGTVQVRMAGEPVALDLDTVILTGQPRPDLSLHDSLRGAAPRIIPIGDCTGPGLIRQATEQAARAVASLGRNATDASA